MEVDLDIEGDAWPVRVELYRDREDANHFRARVWLLETFRVQPTFPLGHDGEPQDKAGDEDVLVEWSYNLADDFDSFAGRLQALLADERFDVLVQAAAVSDWRPARAEPGKIDSDAATMVLRLERTPKLVALAQGWSRNPALRIVAFKLTAGADEATRRAKVEIGRAHV